MPETLYQGDKDLQFIREADMEMFQLHFPPTPWYQIDQTIEKNIYGEYAKGGRDKYVEYHTPVNLYIEPNPSQKMLNKLGITDKRDFAFEMSKHQCNQIGLIPKIGDRFDWGDYQAEIEKIDEGSFFANYHQKDLHLFGTAKKSRTFKEE